MVRPIMRDPLFLAGKSESATEADKQVVQDLLDTLKANQDRCVGMAALQRLRSAKELLRPKKVACLWME